MVMNEGMNEASSLLDTATTRDDGERQRKVAGFRPTEFKRVIAGPNHFVKCENTHFD
jgi:hypothetical protein